MITKEINIEVDLNNSEIVKKLLSFQETETQINSVCLNYKNNNCKDLSTEALQLNRKYNLPKTSNIGLLLAIGKNTEL
jgi:hypothetical protein